MLEHEYECLEQIDNLIAQKYDNLKKIMKEKQLVRNAVAAKKKAERTTFCKKTAAYVFGVVVGTAAVNIYFGNIGLIGEFIPNDLSTHLSNLL